MPLIKPCSHSKNLETHRETLCEVRKLVHDIYPDFSFEQPGEWEDSEIQSENDEISQKLKIALEHPFFKVLMKLDRNMKTKLLC